MINIFAVVSERRAEYPDRRGIRQRRPKLHGSFPSQRPSYHNGPMRGLLRGGLPRHFQKQHRATGPLPSGHCRSYEGHCDQLVDVEV